MTAVSRRQYPHEPVAVVGMACRFAGADSPEELWSALTAGLDMTTETPRSRYGGSEETSDPDPDPHPGHADADAERGPRAGYLKDIHGFDAEFFGIEPADVFDIDPQQRLLLMIAWEALEDAGIPPIDVRASRTGVYIGAVHTGYFERLRRLRNSPMTLSRMLSYYRSMLPGRLSFHFDLRGPSVTLDTACSSSLLGVHLARQSLQCGETDLALVGGVNIKLTGEEDAVLARAGTLAADGRTKFGDAGANGLVPSDGVAVIVLKRLSDALHDSDRIHSIIRGSAVVSDGAASGLLLEPSVETHQEMLRIAYRDSGVAPSDVAYVEAHGTGTPAIDPVELKALGAVLGENRPTDRPLYVGSVKTNIGHTEAAAGMAGLIKASLTLRNRTIVPSLNFSTPNPRVPWSELNVEVPTGLLSLTDGREPLYAGVSGQGISSVNVHVVLEEASSAASASPRRGPAGDFQHFLPISARTPRALNDLARAYARYLAPGGPGADLDLRDICYSAALRREHHAYRLAFQGPNHRILAEHIREYLVCPEKYSETAQGPASAQYRSGRTVDWPTVLEPGGQYVPIPTYPWQTTSFDMP